MKNCFVIEECRGIADLVPALEMGLGPNDGKGMIITRINVPQKDRGKRFGTQLLNMILEDADKGSVTLFLEIGSSDGLSTEQLEAWYERHGFSRMPGQYIWKRSPKPRRLIIIRNCYGCPNFRRSGSFGKIAYVPSCALARKDLPYTIHEGVMGLTASVEPGIPDWCPLPKE